RRRDEWEVVFAGTDACVAPVLSLTEAPHHPHNRKRATFVEHGGIVQPAPAPRFDRTPPCLERTPPAPGDHTEEVLVELGFTTDEIDDLVANAVVTRRTTSTRSTSSRRSTP
ncbi:MAG TPA: CoA transferase, partial [Acidimicrobiales bacterium]